MDEFHLKRMYRSPNGTLRNILGGTIYRQHQQDKDTSTNPIASIFAWTRGLRYRGTFDSTPDVVRFAKNLERVCIDTVEGGQMTKDLALLIGPDQKWLTTEEFLGALDDNLKKALAEAQKAATFFPERTSILGCLGGCYASLGKDSETIEIIEQRSACR